MKSFLGMKEPVNTLTHFIAFLTAIAGLVFLIIAARNEPVKLLVMTVYGTSRGRQRNPLFNDFVLHYAGLIPGLCGCYSGMRWTACH